MRVFELFFEEWKIETILNSEGELRIKAANICEILGFEDTSRAVRRFVFQEWYEKLPTKNGGKSALFLTSEGVNQLALSPKCNFEDSKKFREWFFQVLAAYEIEHKNHFDWQHKHVRSINLLCAIKKYLESVPESIMKAALVKIFNKFQIGLNNQKTEDVGFDKWLEEHCKTQNFLEAQKFLEGLKEDDKEDSYEYIFNLEQAYKAKHQYIRLELRLKQLGLNSDLIPENRYKDFKRKFLRLYEQEKIQAKRRGKFLYFLICPEFDQQIETSWKNLILRD